MSLPMSCAVGGAMSGGLSWEPSTPGLGHDNPPLSWARFGGMTATLTHSPTHVPAHVSGHGGAPVLPAVLADRVRDLRAASKAANTQRAYQADWRRWTTWCEAQGLCPLPAHPDTVSAYLADQAGSVKVSTLARHLATVSKAHQVAGLSSPCRETAVRDTLAGLRRTHGAPADEAPGLLADGMRVTLDCLPGDMAGLRDRALLLVGWCAGLRRSEVAGLTWGDLAADPDGLVLTLRHSKTDHTGQGRQVGLPRAADLGVCPVYALQTWREAVAHECAHLVADDAPVFVQITRHGHLGGAMSGQAVAQVIQRRTAQAGLPGAYRGHSLRKGLVQEAKLAGVSDSAVMATTGHQSVTMLRRYQGSAGLVSRAASRGLLSHAARRGQQ